MQQENTSDALQRPPTFNELVGLIKKLYFDYMEDVLKSTPEEREKSWKRYKTLNHLYQDKSANEQPVEQKENDAVKFGEWIRKHKYRPFREGQWIVLESGDTKTTAQLYNEYREQK